MSRLLSRPVHPLGRARPGPGAPGPAVPGPRAGRRGALPVLAVLAVTAAAASNGLAGLWPFVREPIDLRVYTEASSWWAAGQPLYSYSTPDLHLPFTYPPVAALLVAPFAWLPFGVATVLWVVLSLLALVAIVRRLVPDPLPRWLEPLGGRLPPTARPGRRVVVAAICVLALLLRPVRDTLSFGQVNLLLAAAIVADFLDDPRARPRWAPPGVLVGLAAAVKLTPALFVLGLLVMGRRRAAAYAAATFAIATGLAHLVMPGDSARFWLVVVHQASRVGDPAYWSNSSIYALALRAGLDPPAATRIWLPLAAVVALVALRRAVLAARSGATVSAVAILGLAAVLISPISWVHHLVWVLVALAAQLRAGHSRQRAFALATLLVFVVPLPRWGHEAFGRMPDEPLGILLQASYALAALAVLLTLPLYERRKPARPEPAVLAARLAAARSGSAGHAVRPPNSHVVTSQRN